MKRSPFPRPEYERPLRQFGAITRPSAEWNPSAAIKPAEPKTPDRKSQAIRDSARGEECTVRIVGACSHDPAKTIWSHAPLQSAGKGGAIKALDLCGAYACTACDAVVDGQAPLPPGASRASVLADWHEGHLRSLVRLRQKGLI